VNTLIADPPPGAPVPPILPPEDGFLYLDKEKFHDSFAGDVSDEQAAFMADSQVPWGVDALGGTISEPAWRNKPSWYLVATEDRMIPPPAQRQMSERAGATVVEVEGSHAIYVSKPDLVAELIGCFRSGIGHALSPPTLSDACGRRARPTNQPLTEGPFSGCVHRADESELYNRAATGPRGLCPPALRPFATSLPASDM